MAGCGKKQSKLNKFFILATLPSKLHCQRRCRRRPLRMGRAFCLPAFYASPAAPFGCLLMPTRPGPGRTGPDRIGAGGPRPNAMSQKLFNVCNACLPCPLCLSVAPRSRLAWLCLPSAAVNNASQLWPKVSNFSHSTYIFFVLVG